MKSNLNILIDFDNTIANSSKRAIEMAKKHFNIENMPPIENESIKWNFQPYLNEEQSEWAVKQMHTKEFFSALEPCALASMVDFFKMVNANCQHPKFILATNRPIESFKYVLDWLEQKHILEYFSYVFPLFNTFDKSVINADIVIDDKVECLYGDRKLYVLYGNYGYQSTDIFKEKLWENTKLISNLKVTKKWAEIKAYVFSHFFA